MCTLSTSNSTLILTLYCQDEDVDNLPRHTGENTDGALLQLLLEMGETYQIWRDEYPEDTLVYKKANPKGAPLSQEYTAVVIHLKDGGGYKLYCKGAPGYVLPRCTRMALPSLDNVPFGDDNTRRETDDLEKRKQLEVICLASKYFPAVYGKLDFILTHFSIVELRQKWFSCVLTSRD